MRLPRRTSAQSQQGITQELQSVRAGAITPAERARETTAKYGAIAAGAEAVGDVATNMAETQMEMDRASDKLDTAINDAYMEQALGEAKREAEERSLTDPEWTRDNYEKNIDAILRAREDAIEGLRDPENKLNAIKLHKVNSQLMANDARYDALDIEAKKIGTNWSNEYNAAVADERYSDAYRLLDIGTDITSGTPIVAPDKGPELRQELDTLVEKKEISDIVDDTSRVYLNDQEKGDELYREIQETEKDPAKRKAILDGLDAAFANVNRALKREKEQDEAGYIFYEQELDERITAGLAVDLMSEYEEGNIGEVGSKSAANRYARLRDKQVVGVKVNQTAIDFSEKLLNGDPIPATDAFRKHTDKFTATMPIPEDSDAETERAKFYKGISLVGKEDSDNLKGSIHTIAGLVKTAGLFAKLTDDPLNEPNMGMNEKQRAVHELNKKLLSYGIPPDQAAEDTLKRVRIDENTRNERADKWRDGELVAFTGDTSESGEQRAAESYAEVVDSDYYDMPGLWNVESPGYEAYLDYQGMYRNAFMQTGDWDVAMATANRQFKETYNANNLNSADGDDYQIMQGPIKGDATNIKKKMLSMLELDTQKYLVRADNGVQFYPSKVSPEDITFENPRKDGDEWVYTVMNKGVAIPRTANTSVDIRLDADDLSAVKAFTEKEDKVARLNTSIKKNEEQIEAVARYPTGPDAFMTAPYITYEPKTLKREIGMFQSDIEKAEAGFKERYPKF